MECPEQMHSGERLGINKRDDAFHLLLGVGNALYTKGGVWKVRVDINNGRSRDIFGAYRLISRQDCRSLRLFESFKNAELQLI